MCLPACAWEGIYLCTRVPISVCACRHVCVSLHDCGYALSVCVCAFECVCLDICVCALEWCVYTYVHVTINTSHNFFCLELHKTDLITIPVSSAQTGSNTAGSQVHPLPSLVFYTSQSIGMQAWVPDAP